VVICAKTAEPIEMPFGLSARVGPRLLDRGPHVLRDVAMATIFWLSTYWVKLVPSDDCLLHHGYTSKNNHLQPRSLNELGRFSANGAWPVFRLGGQD